MMIAKLPVNIKSIILIIITGLLFLVPPVFSTEKEDYNAIKYKALVLIKKGDCTSAINLLTKLESINQVDSNVFLLRGRCWLKLGEYQYAQNDLNRAIKMDPNNDNAFYFRAICREKTGQLDLAIDDYNRAIEIKPAVTLYSKRSSLWKKIGQLQNARLDLTKVIKLISEDSYGYYDSAIILHNMGNYIAAIQDYKKSIELNPNNSLALNGLALLYATSEDENFRDEVEAMRLALKAVDLEEHHSNYATLAAAYAEVGNFQEAINIQNKAITLAEKSPDTESITDYHTILKNYISNKPWRGNPPISGKEWESFFSIVEN